VSGPTWTSTREGFLDQFPKDVGDLWLRTQKKVPSSDYFAIFEPVFGEGDTWYFWDETWGDACGPYPTEAQARAACTGYAAQL
jgi:hypothetical protein